MQVKTQCSQRPPSASGLGRRGLLMLLNVVCWSEEQMPRKKGIQVFRNFIFLSFFLYFEKEDEWNPVVFSILRRLC